MIALVTLCYHMMAQILGACNSMVITLEMNPCSSISKRYGDHLINFQLCQRDPVAQMVLARMLPGGHKKKMVKLLHSGIRVNLMKLKKLLKRKQKKKRPRPKRLQRNAMKKMQKKLPLLRKNSTARLTSFKTTIASN